MIPIAQPTIGMEEIKAVKEVMLSGNIASGKKVEEFENNFKTYCDVKRAIAVNNGTTALHTSLLALGVGSGDEVIVPNFTFVATASAVVMCGAKPVFCDVDLETYNIIPEDISELITPKTKVVIGVHLYGQSCDTISIREICDDKKLRFVEDAAQAHGVLDNGYKVGGLSDVGCFSFYATKNMTTGEGGMITTDNVVLEDKIRRIINHGQSKKYVHSELGYNYRMTDIQAAMGIEQLKKLDEFNDCRQFNARYYINHLNDLKGLIKPPIKDSMEHVFHQYVIRITDDFHLCRESFMDYLKEKEIGSAIHYPIPLNNQPMMKEYNNGKILPNSGLLSNQVVSLPVHPNVNLYQLKYICETINNIE